MGLKIIASKSPWLALPPYQKWKECVRHSATILAHLPENWSLILVNGASDITIGQEPCVGGVWLVISYHGESPSW
jgi:hypothetical protein